MDTGATRHVCSDKKMFSSYHSIDNGEQLLWATPLLPRLKPREISIEDDIGQGTYS